ncbi:MAG: hypothetical protein ACRELA_12160 [Candidatus Rokuibacteriota bacterium]
MLRRARLLLGLTVLATTLVAAAEAGRILYRIGWPGGRSAKTAPEVLAAFREQPRHGRREDQSLPPESRWSELKTVDAPKTVDLVLVADTNRDGHVDLRDDRTPHEKLKMDAVLGAITLVNSDNDRRRNSG